MGKKEKMHALLADSRRGQFVDNVRRQNLQMGEESEYFPKDADRYESDMRNLKELV